MLRCLCLIGIAAILLPTVALAQEGQIAGTVRDSSGGVIPGVTIEAASPALIEKIRTTTTDANGQYRLTNLPVGTYTVTFTLGGFTTQRHDNIVLSSGFTASVNAAMAVGGLAEEVVVTGVTPTVDVQNARQAVVFDGDQIRELPTARNVNSLLQLTPGISSNYRAGQGFGEPGICVGGIGVFCNPGLNGFNVGDNDATLAGTDRTTNLQQGRVMVDGVAVNGGAVLPLGGLTNGYTADIAAAQEINIQLSGGLGESETGGASINIVSRSGGNRFAGTWDTRYTRENWFDRNNSAYETGCTTVPRGVCVADLVQSVRYDYDYGGSFGGPIKRDKLWFYVQGRDQGIQKIPGGGGQFWPNLNEGKWGYNYQPDRSKEPVEYRNIWKNIQAKLTYQLSQKNKINFLWDEQDFCQDPCLGVVSIFTSPESWWSVAIKPNRLQQVTWTNPLTNKILLEAGLTIKSEHYDTTRHREFRNPSEIPRVDEFGDTVGMDSVAPRVNNSAGGFGFNLTSGSLVSALAGGGAEQRDNDSYRTRASLAYVTGGHHAKVGWDGGYYMQDQTNQMNDSRLFYRYSKPATNCATLAPLETYPCGNTSLQFPTDPYNLALRPVPLNVQFYTGVGTVRDRVWYGGLYAQDQWTLQRFTFSGALRYDHAESRYLSTCIGGANEPFMPVQADGSKRYCTPDSDGVSFHDITPRWGAVWDVFGTGRTSLKWNMGRYNNQAAISGIYSQYNPARRTVNTLQRSWSDLDGDRIVDCNLTSTATNGECGAFNSAGAFPGTDWTDTARFGKDPSALDSAGNPIGLNVVHCGRAETGIFPTVSRYCDQYGDSLISGWGKRRYEWQLGIGVQHEILPRLSGEVTYNRRLYRNLTTEDQLGLGCDRFAGAVSQDDCVAAMLQYSNPTYDFYSVRAPTDPRLPGGGGYLVTGLNDQRINVPGTCVSAGIPVACEAVTIDPRLNYYWHGVDTNFVWRGPFGIRVNGGTNTGRTSRETCITMNDAPSVRGIEGREHEGGCKSPTIWTTRVNGSAAYVIPWADILVSSVFQSVPGPSLTATFTYNKNDLIWYPQSAFRALEPCTGASAALGTGCLGTSRNTSTANAVQLLLPNQIIGERTTIFDLKFAKNIRFQGKRATVGVDVYNVFNSDAINSYQSAFTGSFVNGVWTPAVDNPATNANEGNQWGNPTTLVSPRFVRATVQFNF